MIGKAASWDRNKKLSCFTIAHPPTHPPIHSTHHPIMSCRHLRDQSSSVHCHIMRDLLVMNISDTCRPTCLAKSNPILVCSAEARLNQLVRASNAQQYKNSFSSSSFFEFLLVCRSHDGHSEHLSHGEEGTVGEVGRHCHKHEGRSFM